MAPPSCLPVSLHLHPLQHSTVAARVTSVRDLSHSGIIPLTRCRWLIAHDYEDEAFKILADLENKSEDDPFILAQHKEIVYTVQYERENAVPWSKLLRGKTGDKGGTKTIRRLLLGAGTQAMQQLAGINGKKPQRFSAFCLRPLI